VRKRALFLFVSALLFAVAAGIVFELIGARRDKEQFPRVGFPVDIGGRSLNIAINPERIGHHLRSIESPESIDRSSLAHFAQASRL
jgi:hypothetical protein